MATNFPSSADSFTNPSPSDDMATVSHSSQHANVNDAVEAIETALLDGAPLHIDDANERVGVGTTSPSVDLEVAGTAKAQDIVASASVTALSLTVDTDVLHVDSTNDRVGIGTTSPSQELDVNGDIVVPVGNGIMFDRSGTDLHILYKETPTSTTYGAGDDVILRNPNGADILFQTNGSNTRLTIDSSGNVGIGTTNPDAVLHVNGEIIHASQWAGVSGPTSWASAYKNNWNQARDQGSFMTAGSTGITINRSGRYHVIAGQRCNSTNDAYFGIGENGNRTTLENRTTGIWSHDHAASPNLWTKSVYVGYLAANEILTSGAPNSTVAGYLTFSTAGWAGYMVAIWLGD